MNFFYLFFGKIWSLLRHRGVRVLALMGLYLVLAPHLPMGAHRFLYSLSLSIKGALTFLMPALTFFFVSSSIPAFKKSAPLFLVTLFLFEFCSNFLSVCFGSALAYLYSGWGTLASGAVQVQSQNFQPLWSIHFPSVPGWTPSCGVFFGVAAGLLGTFSKSHGIVSFLDKGRKAMETILTRGFAPIIPVFLLGFFVKNYQASSRLGDFFCHYAGVIATILGGTAFYLCLLYLGMARGSFSKARESMGNILPAFAMAFSSGCSLSTMPSTIKGTQKNVRDPRFASIMIPMTTNIQQAADCILNSALALILYYKFLAHFPLSLAQWAAFALVFVMARFATSAVMGGAIFIMMPIYEQYLHFTPEMVGIMFAFNGLLDPFVTSGNVAANSALCRIFEDFWAYVSGKVFKKSPSPSKAP